MYNIRPVGISGSLSLTHFVAYSSWAWPWTHSNASVLERLPSSTQEGPMFSGLRSDTVALSHMWLGLPGGCFQSDGGLRIAAATVWWWTSSGTLRAMWPNNLKRRSVTVLESRGTLTLPWFLCLFYDECKGSSGSCGEPMYQMHLTGHTHKYLVVTQVSHPDIRTGTIYVLYSCILVSSLMLDFQIRFPAGSCKSNQCLSSAGPGLCWHQKSLSCFPDRQVSRPLLLVHLPPGQHVEDNELPDWRILVLDQFIWRPNDATSSCITVRARIALPTFLPVLQHCPQNPNLKISFSRHTPGIPRCTVCSSR